MCIEYAAPVFWISVLYPVSPEMKSRLIGQLQSYWDFYASSHFLKQKYDIWN